MSQISTQISLTRNILLSLRCNYTVNFPYAKKFKLSNIKDIGLNFSASNIYFNVEHVALNLTAFYQVQKNETTFYQVQKCPSYFFMRIKIFTSKRDRDRVNRVPEIPQPIVYALLVTKTRVVSSLYDAGTVLHLHALVKAVDTEWSWYVAVDMPGGLERMQTHVKRMKSSTCNSASRIRKAVRRHVGGHRSHQFHIYCCRSVSPLRQRSKLIEWSSNNRRDLLIDQAAARSTA